jgi:hypothetical protein
MRSSEIYNKVYNTSGKSDRSFGTSDGFDQEVYVGTSKKNSHLLGHVEVEKFEDDENGEIHFILSVDGVPVKRSRHLPSKVNPRKAGVQIAIEWMVDEMEITHTREIDPAGGYGLASHV